jgi:hypothetical protein
MQHEGLSDNVLVDKGQRAGGDYLADVFLYAFSGNVPLFCADIAKLIKRLGAGAAVVFSQCGDRNLTFVALGLRIEINKNVSIDESFIWHWLAHG